MTVTLARRSADDTRVLCNRCRIVRKFSAECLEGDSLAEVRMQAAARAVELALEYRVTLESAREAREPI